MEKSQEELLKLIVDQVLKKHGVEKEGDLSSKDKQSLIEVVEKLKEDVETYTENEKKIITERDQANRNSKSNHNTAADETISENNRVNQKRSKNDRKTLKTYFR
ncbi:hypothetical protein ACM26V_19510 [Salipaludibacillus sp. HK11]|uniref:hypothetical protein n=1 Tax=Salipaludibacillus sp. HK11 TaxID=3394320 RepID=UPI0039FBE495